METDGPAFRQGDGDANRQPIVSKRERSTIRFPYMDLATSLQVASAVYARNGQADCQIDELAAQMKLSSSSSGFRSRVSAARVFGLLNASRGAEVVSLTELGLRAVDRTSERKAKTDAFLRVDLFRTVYERYKGAQLPPAAALEREMLEFGVASKQAERARQILERSAETAGFFESGRDRLVRPAGIGTEDRFVPDSQNQESAENHLTRSEQAEAKEVAKDETDPIIKGLLARLPASGSTWPKAERDLWLDLLRGSFDLIYRSDSEG